MGGGGSQPEEDVATNQFNLETNWLARVFSGVITNLWPKSNPRSRGIDELVGDHAKRVIESFHEYARFQHLCWKFLVLVDVGDANMPYTNYCQPDNTIRLRYPLNVPDTGKSYKAPIFNGKEIITVARDLHTKLNYYIREKKQYQESYLYEIKAAFSPYASQTDLRNILEFIPEDEKPIDMDLVRRQYTEWFKNVWPICDRAKGYINQIQEEFEEDDRLRHEQYDEWVENNFVNSMKRTPEQGYDSWVLPYTLVMVDGKPKLANVPSDLARLRDGVYRTELLTKILPLNDWTNFRFHFRERPIAWWKQVTDFAHKNATLSLQPLESRVNDFGDDTKAVNAIWGSAGHLQKLYPPNWPFPILPAFENRTYPGCMSYWPLPMMMVNPNYCVLPESVDIEEPEESILVYWSLLINTFENKNKALIIPWSYRDMLVTEEANKDRAYGFTNRVGYKIEPRSMMPNATTMGNNNTQDMLQIENALNESFKITRNGFFYRNCGDFAKFAGIDPRFHYSFPNYPFYEDWKMSVIIAWHLKLAERHYQQPWEQFKTIRSKAESGVLQEIHDALEKAHVSVDWLAQTWADQMITTPYRKALDHGTFPHSGKHNSRQDEIIQWQNMYNLFYHVQTWIKKYGSAEPLNLKLIPRSIYYNVATMIFHRYEPTMADQWLDPMADFCKTMATIVNETSNAATWNLVMQHYIAEFYRSCMIKSQVILRRLGECNINPQTILTETCQRTTEIDYGLKNTLSAVDNVWVMWRKQWDMTRDYAGWPKYRLNSDSTVTLIEGAPPLPGYFEKYWNTILGFFRSSQPNLGKGSFIADPIENRMPGNIGGGTGFIQGFILPSGAVRNDARVQELYDFVQANPIPIIGKIPPLLDTDAFQTNIDKQWVAYRRWVEANIEAQKHIHYQPPNQQLRDAEGNGLYDPEDPSKPVMNRVPTFGVFPPSDINSFSWVFSPGQWPENLTGVKSWLELAGKIARIVIAGLELLVEAVAVLLPSLLVIGTFVAGLGLVYVYVTRESRIKRIEASPITT
jgi:hypothetical protein